MGIQSGSPRIRRDIFHRVETQEDIIGASKVLSECKIPRIVYDFMLRHPFETKEDIMQSFELCTKLYKPFELQLHGLNFLPGTDIVDLAIKMGVADAKELEEVMYAPMKQQYTSYWGVNDRDMTINFWYSMIYMTQFKFLDPITNHILAKFNDTTNDPKAIETEFPLKLIMNSNKMLMFAAKMKDYYLKLRLVTRSS
jgi:anaerobic magnesium-protoporphyrin IX monomethyl ester cyclase